MEALRVFLLVVPVCLSGAYSYVDIQETSDNDLF